MAADADYNDSLVLVEQVYPCKQCGKQFYAASSLHSHRKRTHTSWEQKLKCSVCPRTFAFQSELLRHLDTAHNISQYNVQASMAPTVGHVGFPAMMTSPQPPVIISPKLPPSEVSSRSPPQAVSSPDSHHQPREREGLSPHSPASYGSSRAPHDAPMHKANPTSLQVPTIHSQLPQMMPTEKNIYKSPLEQNYKKSPQEQFMPSSNGHKRESPPAENGMDLTSYKQKRREAEKYNDMKEPEEPHKMENGYANGNKMAAAGLDEGLVRDVSLNSVMVQSSEGMRYKCTVCSMLLKSKECLALHVNAKHTQVTFCSF